MCRRGAMNLAQAGHPQISGNVLEHLAAGGNVEGVVGNRQAVSRSVGNFHVRQIPQPLSRQRNGGGIDVNAEEPINSQFASMFQQRAFIAADIDQRM